MIRPIALTLALSLAPALFAETYIVPDRDCGAVTFHATSSKNFPTLGEAIGADRVNTAYVYQSKQRVAVKPAAGAQSLTFDAKIADDGVVMAAVDFAPVVSGDETRTEHAKALVFCGATPIADWQRSTGLGLEIFPQGWNGPRPQMKKGDTMRFIAVDKTTNKIVGDVPMQLFRAGGGRVADGTPAQYGGMNFQYPEPGRYMVVATYRRPDPAQPEHWLVDTSTLTFDVK